MRSQYQGVRSTPPAPSVSVNTGGSLTSAKIGTYWFYLQTRNRAGYSKMSTGVQADISTAGQKIDIVIPADARRSGEDVHEFVISVAVGTNNPAASFVVASYGGYLSNGTQSVLPKTVSLIYDAHLGTGLTVANPSGLPTQTIEGMRRQVTSLGKIQEYKAGTWKDCFPNEFDAYQPNDLAQFGANQDVRDISDTRIVLKPVYGATGGNSSTVTFWIVNDTDQSIQKGTRVNLAVDINGEDASDLFTQNNAMVLTFRGFANTTTGVLDITGQNGTGTMPGVGDDRNYVNRPSNLILEKALPVGSAYQLSVTLNFSVADLGGRVMQGSEVKVFPYFGVGVGVYTELGELLGDMVYRNSNDPDDGLRRILPHDGLNAIALAGSGIVNNFGFSKVEKSSVPGFLDNTANQSAIVTGNGQVFAYNGTIPDTAARRASVSTLEGVGALSPYSTAIACNGSQTLSVTVTYPTAFRADYPDVIKGLTSERFVAPYVRISLKNTGNTLLYQYDFPVTPDALTDTFVIGSNVPTASAYQPLPQPAYDFYKMVAADMAIATQNGASVLPAGSYQVAIAPLYINCISAVNHADVGCIRERESGLIGETGPKGDKGDKGDPTDVSSFLTQTTGDARYPLKTATDPYPTYLTQAEAAALFSPIGGEAQGGLRYNYVATTGTATTGQIRFNNATLASVTALSIHETDRNSAGQSIVLDAIAIGTRINVQLEDNEEIYAWFRVSGTVVDNGSDRTIPVAFVSSAGTFAAGEVTVDFLQIQGAASGGHLIEVNGTALTQRGKLNIVATGATYSDDAAGDRTVVNLPAGGGAVGAGLKFTLNTTAGAPAAGEIRSTNLEGGGTIALNPVDTQANASDILGRLGVGAIVDLRNSDSKWVRGTVTTAWTAVSGSFTIGDVRSSGAIANAETVYLSIASDSPPSTGGLIATSLQAFGDSITAGTGASAASNRYVNLVATNTGWGLTNAAVSGHEALDQIDAVYAFNPDSLSQSLVMLGYNDLAFYGTSSTGQSTFSDAIKTIAAWLSIPATKRAKGQDAAITYSGTWANTANYGGSVSKRSSTASNTATYTFSGSAFLLATTRSASGTGVFTVAIDGGTPVTVTGANASASALGRNYGPSLSIFSGLTDTTHTAVITVSSGTVDIEWLAGVSDATPGYVGATCFVGNIIKRNTASFGGSPPVWDINSTIGAYNLLIKNAVSNLSLIGLRAVYVNANNRFSLANLAADNIHPNDTGHAEIANAFIDKIRITPGLLLNGGSGGGSTTPTVYLQDTFTGTDGTAIVGKMPDIGSFAWYKIASVSGNGQITSNRATDAGLVEINAAINAGISSYLYRSVFLCGAAASGVEHQFIVRAGAANSETGIIFQMQNNRLKSYSAVSGTYTLLFDDAFTQPSSGIIEIAVTPTTVTAVINGGAYQRTLTTSVNASNTGVGFAVVGAGYAIDSITVSS